MKRFILLTCFANAFQPKFMLAPETGGGTGGGGTGSQKPPTVPELTQKVTTLESEKQALITERDAEKQKVTTLEGEKQALLTERDAEKQKVTTLEGEKQALITERDAEKQKVTTLESEKQTITKERDQARIDKTKADEQLANAGIKPPETQTTQEAGKQQSGDDSGKAPSERLSSFFTTGK